jgi:nucleotide-binding universal stress UspA family protein
MKKGMRILIAYDGSEPSQHALEQGVSLAKLTDSDVTIMSVVPRIMIPVFTEPGTGASMYSAKEMANAQRAMSRYYSESLKEASQRLASEYPELKVETELLEGRPSQAIIDMAENDGFDLIVIGSRGLGGITGWILGSTSRRVVDSCTVPVLLIK